MYIVPLAFLSPAAKQNYKALTVTAKIDSISRAKVDAVFLNAASNAFCIGEVALCHSSNRDRHFRGGRRALNHLAYGELPSAARYSRTSITAYGNT